MAGDDVDEEAPGGKNRKRQKPRIDGWTEQRRTLFIQTLRGTMNIAAAARAVGLSARGAYDLRRRDAAFGREWELAMDDAQTDLRFTLMRHALKGVETRETMIEGGDRHAVTRWTRVRHSWPVGLMLRLAQVSATVFAPGPVGPAGQQSMQRIKAQIDAVRLRIGRAPLRLPEDMPDDGREG